MAQNQGYLSKSKSSIRRRSRKKTVAAKRNGKSTKNSYKQRLIVSPRTDIGITQRNIAIDDMLEVSRLTEDLLRGIKVSDIRSSSSIAKGIVLGYHPDRKMHRAKVSMYNKLNKQIVRRNKQEMFSGKESIELYKKLMSD